MQTFLVMVVSSLLSALGWAVGAPTGLMAAFVLSMVGMGAGIWLGRRLIAWLLP